MGSTNKPWKVFERLVARYFNGKRIVPSDDRSQGDVLHPYLYLECKAYTGKTTKPAIVTLYEKTAGRADGEDKRAVVCNKRKGTSDFLITCAASDLEAVYFGFRERMKLEKFDG